MALSSVTLLLRYCVAGVGACWCWLTICSFAWFVSTQHPLAYLNYHHPLPAPVQHHSDGDTSVLWPLLFDLMLISIFILQHSVMATDWWRQNMAPVVLGRCLYVWATAAALSLLMWAWNPIGGTPVWYIDTSERPLLWTLFCAVHCIAWLLSFLTTVSMDCGELLGLTQVYTYCGGRPPPLDAKSAEARRLYSRMRHGGATCMMVVLWVHPMMTFSRLLLACLLASYVCCGFCVRREDHEYVQRTQQRWKTGGTVQYEYQVVS